MTDAKSIVLHHPWWQHASAEIVIMGDGLGAALSAYLHLAKNPAAEIAGMQVGYDRIFFTTLLSAHQTLNTRSILIPTSAIIERKKNERIPEQHPDRHVVR